MPCKSTTGGPDPPRCWLSRPGRQVVSVMPRSSCRGVVAMSVFTEAELRYLTGGQQLGRLATVGADGTPHVVPVGWIYNAARDAIDVGGNELEQSKKFRDIARSGRAAIVIDDLESTDPWRPRAVEAASSPTRARDRPGPRPTPPPVRRPGSRRPARTGGRTRGRRCPPRFAARTAGRSTARRHPPRWSRPGRTHPTTRRRSPLAPR